MLEVVATTNSIRVHRGVEQNLDATTTIVGARLHETKETAR